MTIELDHLPHFGGIYAIENKLTGTRYIGSGKDIRKRCMKHPQLLRRGKHHTIYLQHAWDKYGEDAFHIIVLERVDDEAMLTPREQHHLDNTPDHYNTRPIVDRNLHKPVREETRKKISQSLMGKKLSPETIAKRTATWHKNHPKKPKPPKQLEMHFKHPYAKRAYVMTPARIAMFERAKGTKRAPETGAKISATHKARGVNLSPQARAASLIGRKGRPKSDAWKAKASIAQSKRPRKPHTAEAKAKISAAGRARGPRSAETIAKMRAASIGHKGPTGSSCSFSKLTWELVRELRAFASDGWTNRQLADKFGIHIDTARLIVQYKTWKE